MKTNRILQTVLLVVVIAIAASCSPGREYSYHRYPAPRTSFSLILSGGPGIIVNRYPDGRYYYRSPEGYLYWRGYDNRYYLDRQYLGRGHYEQHEYNEWNRNWKRHRNGGRH